MQKSTAKMLEQLDDLEALLITAEGLASRIKLDEVAETASCIRDTLSEIRRARQSLKVGESAQD